MSLPRSTRVGIDEKGKEEKKKKGKKRGSDRFAAVVVSERMEKKGEAGRDEGKRMTSFRGS